ncbi:AAA family ATPase [Wenzhouxiangella sp. XN201]|uniref:AAA family ATPase n=1 Tax=Wenzhouxiangella sp. XN201 TaxID=2710755 RepID=UPI0013C9CC94|nr:ATP-binding protein [Wenzhouxiangella sp. XN201]NEZ03260.1 AAA family ATPase [Wenzhouxiangella sp. XN201]
MARHAIAPERLRWQPEIEKLPADSTRDLPVLEGTLGQESAADALRYGITHPGHNQHVFVRGPRGSGRERLVESQFGSLKPKARQFRDFCFVHNFSNPDRPHLITLPRGEGRSFQRQMHRMALFIRERLPEILANDPIRSRREARRETAERDIRALLRPLESKLDAEGLALVRSQAGPNARLQVSIKLMGKPVSQEEFRNMVARKQATEADRKKIEARIATFEDELQKIARQIRKKWQQAQQHIEQIDVAETARILGDMTSEISERFKAPGIDAYLREIIDDVLEKRIGHETSQLADPTVLYGVNVLNMGGDDEDLPLITTNTVTPANLFGTVDPTWRSGDRAVASYRGIRSGALIQADGGFLVLDAEDLVNEPEAFRQLLRILRAGEVAITSPITDASHSSQSLRPESVPVDVGVILIGDQAAYRRLEAITPEFTRRFRLLADLELTIPRDAESMEQTCRFMASMVQEQSLPPLTRPGLAAMLEVSHRLADRTQRLTTRVGQLTDVVREAGFIAGRDNSREISRDHVDSAFEHIRRRAGVQWLNRLHDDIDSERIRLRGRSAGQVNLVVSQRQSDLYFGVPTRLSMALVKSQSAKLSLEYGARSDQPRQFLLPLLGEMLQLSGVPSIQATLSIAADIDAEDLDATLLGQACGLVATLAGLSMRQDIAVIGALDARGQVIGVDHVNERVEGFFEACKHVGLTGKQGVIIPAANQNRLALDKSVVKACTNDQFHVYGVAGIGEALELLTGKPAGTWKENAFSADSVLERAREALQP